MTDGANPEPHDRRPGTRSNDADENLIIGVPVSRGPSGSLPPGAAILVLLALQQLFHIETGSETPLLIVRVRVAKDGISFACACPSHLTRHRISRAPVRETDGRQRCQYQPETCLA